MVAAPHIIDFLRKLAQRTGSDKAAKIKLCSQPWRKISHRSVQFLLSWFIVFYEGMWRWLLHRILLIFYANSPKGQARTKLRKSSYARNHDEKYSIGLCNFYCLDLLFFMRGCGVGCDACDSLMKLLMRWINSEICNLSIWGWIVCIWDGK